MTTTRTKSWDEVTAAFDRIEEHLRKRFAQVGREAATERTHLEKSVRGAVELVEQLLDASAKTVRDATLRDDLRHLAETMRAALLSTMDRAGDELPKAVHRTLPGRAAQAKTAAHPAHKTGARAKVTHPAKRATAAH